ncbi:hypothetical protein A0H81_13237 [Grifola frondosa]|uniref:Uncharacterized protein n=1 Tax=Grifola frondosa TaxID=5627 RepID=A0A1C7LQF9_GRIFR|nr:hypothetical protein A0H81_13237 [Grifola frondosa]
MPLHSLCRLRRRYHIRRQIPNRLAPTRSGEPTNLERISYAHAAPSVTMGSKELHPAASHIYDSPAFDCD